MLLRDPETQSRRNRAFGCAAASLLVLGVGACGPSPTQKPANAAGAAAPAPVSAWPTFVSRQSVRDAFDRQAGIDKTDRTVADCVDVHAVMSCGFVIGAFARDVPEEAAAFNGADAEMPDELLEITGLNSELVSNVDLDGNGSTPARRFHYLGQFKTLIRVLSPGIGAPDLDRLIHELQLGATPQKELRTTARRAFANITCAQGGGASPYIQCQTEKPQK